MVGARFSSSSSPLALVWRQERHLRAVSSSAEISAKARGSDSSTFSASTRVSVVSWNTSEGIGSTIGRLCDYAQKPARPSQLFSGVLVDGCWEGCDRGTFWHRFGPGEVPMVGEDSKDAVTGP